MVEGAFATVPRMAREEGVLGGCAGWIEFGRE